MKIKKSTILFFNLMILFSMVAHGQITVKLTGDWTEKTVPILIGWNGLDTINLPYKEIDGGRTFSVNDDYKNRLLSVLLIIPSGYPVYSATVIYTGEECSVTVDFSNYHKTIRAVDCSVNRDYYYAVHVIDSLTHRIQALRVLISRYPFTESAFIIKMKEKLAKWQNNLNSFYEEDISGYHSAVRDYLLAQRIYMPSMNLDNKTQYEDILNNFYLFRNPGDEAIQQSELFFSLIQELTALLTDYAVLHNNPDSLFIDAIDNFLYQIVDNESLFKEVIQYFWDYFNKQAQEVVIQYLDESYLADQCDGDIDDDLQKRLDAYERLSPGKLAPAIDLQTSERMFTLYNLEAKYTVIVFWSTSCPHCMIAMPELYSALAKNIDSIAVVTIGLDTEKQAWDDAVQRWEGWIHLRAKERWNNTWVKEYGIVATPSFFLLDREKRIIGKAPGVTSLLMMIESE